jgi:hypothetical protein
MPTPRHATPRHAMHDSLSCPHPHHLVRVLPLRDKHGKARKKSLNFSAISPARNSQK